MKRKILLMLAIASILVCALAISVSAATIYKTADGTTLFSYADDNGDNVFDSYTGSFPKTDAEGNALTWYITATATEGSDTVYTVASLKTLGEAGSINGNGAYSFTSPVTNKNTVSVNFPDNQGIKTFAFNTFGGHGSRAKNNILFVYCPNTLTAFANNPFQETNVIVVEIDSETPINNIPQNFAHEARNLEKINIPSSVMVINGNGPQNGAPFYNCKSLTTVTFGPNSELTTILNHVFNGCSSLIRVDFPSGLTSVGTNVFQGTTSLETVTFPDALTALGDEFFRDSGIINWPFSETTQLNSIGRWAFYGASRLEYAYIPAAIDDDLAIVSENVSTFTNCTSLKTVKFAPGSRLSALKCTFKNCRSLEKIEFDPNCPLTEIGNSTFYDCCSLTEIVLPNNVEYVHNRAFQCYNTNGILETVNFGPSFKAFVCDSGDTWYFYKQPKLKTLIFPALDPANVTADWKQLINSSAKPEVKYTGTLESWTAVLAKIKEVANNNNSTFLGITTPTIITNCEAFYGNNHLGEEKLVFTGEALLSSANVCIICTRCESTEVTDTKSALFTNKGYSKSDLGAIMQGFGINKELLSFYNEWLGEIGYGLVAGVYSYVDGEETKYLHETGELLSINEGNLVAANKVATVAFDKKTEYDVFEMKVSGLTEKLASTKIFCCAYVVYGNTVYYISNNTVTVGNAGTAISIGEIQ